MLAYKLAVCYFFQVARSNLEWSGLTASLWLSFSSPSGRSAQRFLGAADQAGRARAGSARQSAAGSRCAGRAAADESLLRTGGVFGGQQGPGCEPRLCGSSHSGAGGRCRRAAPARPAFRRGRLGVAEDQDRPRRRQDARRLYRASPSLVARDDLHRAGIGQPRSRDRSSRWRGTWSFTTEPAPSIQPLEFAVNLRTTPVTLARPVLLGSLQRDLLHPGGQLRADA